MIWSKSKWNISVWVEIFSISGCCPLWPVVRGIFQNSMKSNQSANEELKRLEKTLACYQYFGLAFWSGYVNLFFPLSSLTDWSGITVSPAPLDVELIREHAPNELLRTSIVPTDSSIHCIRGAVTHKSFDQNTSSVIKSRVKIECICSIGVNKLCPPLRIYTFIQRGWRH